MLLHLRLFHVYGNLEEKGASGNNIYMCVYICTPLNTRDFSYQCPLRRWRGALASCNIHSFWIHLWGCGFGSQPSRFLPALLCCNALLLPRIARAADHR